MWKKLIAKIYPNFIYNLSEEDIDNDIISIAVKNNLSLSKDKNNVLKNNFNYVYLLIENINANELRSIISLNEINFNNFTNDELELIAMKIYNKNIDLFFEFINYNPLIITKINYDNFDLDERFNKIFYDNFKFEDIPRKFIENNEILCSKYLENSKIINYRTTLIEYCPNLKEEINHKCFEIIINNLDEYNTLLYNDDMKDILLQSDSIIQNKIFEYLIDRDIKFVEAIYYDFCNNISNNNFHLLLSKYMSGSVEVNKNIIKDIVKIIKAGSDILAFLDILLDLYNRDLISINDFPGLVAKYPIEVLEKDINNIKYCTFKYSKEINKKIIHLLKKNNFSYCNEIKKYFDNNDIFKDVDLFLEVLRANLINKNTFINDGYTILGFAKKDLKNIYLYLQNSIDVSLFEYLKPKIEKVLNYNNYETETILDSVPLTYKVNNQNKSQVMKLLTTIDDNNKCDIILEMDKFNKDFVEEATSILGNRIKVKPLINQNSHHNHYDVDDIISKDKLLQMYADTTKDKVMPSGEVKKLSPYEKYIAAYLIVVNYKKYLEGIEIDDSRAVYQIIDSNNPYIVCAGYVNLLKELLERMGFEECFDWHVECAKSKVGANGPHARLVVYIKDEKYGIDGLYMIDPTWDSENVEKNRFQYVHMTKNEAISDKARFPTKDYLGFGSGPLGVQYNELVNKFMSKDKNSLYIDELFNKPISKDKTIKAMLAISRFSDKNMPMVKENIIGENGYSREEYNEMVASKFYSGISDFIGLNEDIEKFFTEISWNNLCVLAQENSYYQIIKSEVFKRFIKYILQSLDDDLKKNLVYSEYQMVISMNDNIDLIKYVNNIKEINPNLLLSYDFSFGNNLIIDIETIIDKDKPLIQSKDKIVNIINFIYQNNYDKEVKNIK